MMGKFIDMTGWIMKEHGVPNSRITVLKKNTEKYHPVEWWCQCECGKVFSTRGTALRDGTTKSCGCWAQDHAREVGLKNRSNLIGQRFGRLTVLEDTGERWKRQIIWKCQCDCGKITNVCTDYLTTGRTASCGCANYSLGEEAIRKILDDNNMKYISNIGYFKDLVSNNGIPLRYDFIILENNKPARLIEFDGPQHIKSSGYFGGEEELKKLQYHDTLKNEYAYTHNIPLVRIPYKERDKITLEMLLSDKYLVT